MKHGTVPDIFHNEREQEIRLCRDVVIHPYEGRQSHMKWLHNTLGKRNIWKDVAVHQISLRPQL